MSLDEPRGSRSAKADQLGLDPNFDPWFGFDASQFPATYFIDEEDETKCDGCGKQWQSSGDDPVYCVQSELDDENEEGESDRLCEQCAKTALPDIIEEAKTYAEESIEFRIDRLHVFNSMERFAPTPEDYNRGDREAHTENSVLAGNRHNATNYDELIAPLNRNELCGRIYYFAIRHFVDAVIAEVTDNMDADTGGEFDEGAT